MVELRHRHGARIHVHSDAQAEFWEARGYVRASQTEKKKEPVGEPAPVRRRGRPRKADTEKES